MFTLAVDKTQLQRLAARLGRVPERLRAELTDLGHEFREAVVGATPVATGRARKGWGPLSLEESPAGLRVRLANPVPYIHLLEQGRSKQAPEGVFALASERFDPDRAAERLARAFEEAL